MTDKKKVSLDTKKDSFDTIKKAIDDPNTSIQNIVITYPGNPDRENQPVTSEGWGFDLLDYLWHKAKKVNAGRANFLFSKAKSAELWSCEITLTCPDFYRGFRKYTSAIGRWFLKL